MSRAELELWHRDMGHGTGLELWCQRTGRKEEGKEAKQVRMECAACASTDRAPIQAKVAMGCKKPIISVDMAEKVPGIGDVVVGAGAYDRVMAGTVVSGHTDDQLLEVGVELLLGRLGVAEGDVIQYDPQFQNIGRVAKRWELETKPAGGKSHAPAAEAAVKKLRIMAQRLEADGSKAWEVLGPQARVDYVCSIMNNAVLRLRSGKLVVPSVVRWNRRTGAAPRRMDEAGEDCVLATQEQMIGWLDEEWDVKVDAPGTTHVYDMLDRNRAPQAGDPIRTHHPSSWAGKRGKWKEAVLIEYMEDRQLGVCMYPNWNGHVLIGLGKMSYRHGQTGMGRQELATELLGRQARSDGDTGYWYEHPGADVWHVMNRIDGDATGWERCCKPGGRKTTGIKTAPTARGGGKLCGECLIVTSEVEAEDDDEEDLTEGVDDGNVPGTVHPSDCTDTPIHDGDDSLLLSPDTPYDRIGRIGEGLLQEIGGIRKQDLVRPTKSGGGIDWDGLVADITESDDPAGVAAEWAWAMQDAELAWVAEGRIEVIELAAEERKKAVKMGIRLTKKPGLTGGWKRKARVVCKEFKGSNDDESACPVVEDECISLVLSNGCVRGHVVWDWDCKNAYMDTERGIAKEHWAGGRKLLIPPKSLGYEMDFGWDCQVAGFGMTTGAVVLSKSVEKRIQEVAGWTCVEGLAGMAINKNKKAMVCWYGDDFLGTGAAKDIIAVKTHLEKYWILEAREWKAGKEYVWVGRCYRYLGDSIYVFPAGGYDDLPLLDGTCTGSSRTMMLAKVRGSWGWWARIGLMAVGLLAGLPSVTLDEEEWSEACHTWNADVHEWNWIGGVGTLIHPLELTGKVRVTVCTDSSMRRFGLLATVKADGEADWVISVTGRKHERKVREIGRGEAFALEYCGKLLQRTVWLLRRLGYTVEGTSMLSDNYNCVQKVYEKLDPVAPTPEDKACAGVTELLETGMLDKVVHIGGDVNPTDYFTKWKASWPATLLLVGLLSGKGWDWLLNMVATGGTKDLELSEVLHTQIVGVVRAVLVDSDEATAMHEHCWMDSQATVNVIGMKFLERMGHKDKLVVQDWGWLLDCTEDVSRRITILGIAELKTKLGAVTFVITSEPIRPTMGQPILRDWGLYDNSLIHKVTGRIVVLDDYVLKKMFGRLYG